MSKVLRRASWGLAAAVGLGVVHPATAQFTGKLLGRNERTAISVPVENPRVVEIKVELAWLADPATFPHMLEAHLLDSQVIEVKGFVPNRGVRDRALKIARDQSGGLRVLDLLREHSGIGGPNPGRGGPNLESEAMNVLRQEFPGTSKGLIVKGWPDGRVAVTGSIGTAEERLAISRALRRVNGCSCVVNGVNVSAARAPGIITPADGSTFTPVSHIPTQFPSRLPRGPQTPDVLMPAGTIDKTGETIINIDGTPVQGVQTSANPPVPSHPVARKTPEPSGVMQVKHEVPVPPSRPSEPYVSHGEILLEPEGEPEPPAPPTSPASPALINQLNAQMKQRIEQTCGQGLLNLRVAFRNQTDVAIDLWAANESQATAMVQRIFQITEFARYRMDVRVHLNQ